MTIDKSVWASVGLALILGLAIGVYFGNDYGSTKVQGAWDKQAKESANKATVASEDNRGKEADHSIASNGVAADAQISKDKYDADIAAAQSGSDDRVRQSEARADKYRAMSKASAADQARLAKYAAGLDSSLSEGRQLVTELRATLAERERTIHNLSQQITADRKLTGEYDELERNGTPSGSGKADRLGK